MQIEINRVEIMEDRAKTHIKLIRTVLMHHQLLWVRKPQQWGKIKNKFQLIQLHMRLQMATETSTTQTKRATRMRVNTSQAVVGRAVAVPRMMMRDQTSMSTIIL